MKNIINLILSKNHTCPWWLCFTFDNVFRKLIQNPINILSPYIKKGDYVLDLGPGMGFFSFHLSEMVSDRGIVYAADIQKKMLDIINLKAKKKDIGNIRTFLIADKGLNIDLSFDFILLFWMLHEVSDKEVLFKELRNKIKDSGKILIVEPIIHVSRNKFKSELEIARKCGFNIIDYPRISISNAAILITG